MLFSPIRRMGSDGHQRMRRSGRWTLDTSPVPDYTPHFGSVEQTVIPQRGGKTGMSPCPEATCIEARAAHPNGIPGPDFRPNKFRCNAGIGKTIRFPNRTCKRYVHETGFCDSRPHPRPRIPKRPPARCRCLDRKPLLAGFPKKRRFPTRTVAYNPGVISLKHKAGGGHVGPPGSNRTDDEREPIGGHGHARRNGIAVGISGNLQETRT